MTARIRRIAIVCQPWDNVVARTAASIVILSRELARHLARDSRILIYGRRFSGQKSQETASETIELKRFSVLHKPHAIFEITLGIVACLTRSRVSYPLSYLYHLVYALRVALSIRASKCDVVIVHNFLQFASLIKLLNPSAAVCVHMHCEWLSYYATEVNERRLRRLDLVIGCSDYITGKVKSRFPSVAARCHTVYNGVNAEVFQPADRPPQNHGASILFLGRIIPEWGIHILIRAFKVLAAAHPNLRLDIVGAANTGRYLWLCPDLKDQAIADMTKAFYGNRLSEMVRRQFSRKGQSYLNDLVAEAGGEERITFHGGVSHTETLAFYRRAVMLVFPAIVNAPSPLPTYEAAASGLPIVATHSGGIPEIVEHGKTGLLVPRGDARELARAIAQLLDDPALARAMGEAGRQRVIEHFTWDASARRLADLIEGVPFSTPQAAVIARGESTI
jgi:spore coat protein SA